MRRSNVLVFKSREEVLHKDSLFLLLLSFLSFSACRSRSLFLSRRLFRSLLLRSLLLLLLILLSHQYHLLLLLKGIKISLVLSILSQSFRFISSNSSLIFRNKLHTLLFIKTLKHVSPSGVFNDLSDIELRLFRLLWGWLFLLKRLLRIVVSHRHSVCEGFVGRCCGDQLQVSSAVRSALSERSDRHWWRPGLCS